MDIKTAIEMLLKDPLITNYQISKATGISQVSLNKFAKGESNIENMPLSNALKLYDYYLKIKEDEKMRVSNPLIFDLTRKFTGMIMDGTKLCADYEERLAYIFENVKRELGEDVGKAVEGNLLEIVDTYKKTGVWDFVGFHKK